MAAKRTISREQYLQLLGLELLGKTAARKAEEYADAIADLLGTDTRDHASDVIFGSDEQDVEWLLAAMQIEVEGGRP